MQIAKTVEGLKNILAKTDANIGFVPTLGALHAGHLQLIAAAKSKTKVVVCSIFVNPLQFNNAEDLAKYPRTTEQDIALLETHKCDILFLPSVEEIYENTSEIEIYFSYQNTVMEGLHRPGHFSGVAVVVTKLFHFVNPKMAFFGQKDLQQCLIIKQLVDTFSFNVILEIVPTVREADGLAMSSRNVRLSSQGRQIAPTLYKNLQIISNNLYQYLTIKENCLVSLQANKNIQIHYLNVVDMENGKVVEIFEKGKKYGICIAATIDNVRLIDNVITVY